jgi:hypothetical protein
VDVSNKRIRFSHPSYSEAIRYIISENGSLTKSGKILSSVLVKLSSDNFAAGDVAKTIVASFSCSSALVFPVQQSLTNKVLFNFDADGNLNIR